MNPSGALTGSRDTGSSTVVPSIRWPAKSSWNNNSIYLTSPRIITSHMCNVTYGETETLKFPNTVTFLFSFFFPFFFLQSQLIRPLACRYRMWTHLADVTSQFSRKKTTRLSGTTGAKTSDTNYRVPLERFTVFYVLVNITQGTNLGYYLCPSQPVTACMVTLSQVHIHHTCITETLCAKPFRISKQERKPWKICSGSWRNIVSKNHFDSTLLACTCGAE